MMKKKKQSRSQSSTEKNSKKPLEPSSDSSPSPRLLSLFRSKLASSKDLKHMLRGMRSKTAPGLSSQSRIVRCPKCHKLLQEPIDATIYKCSGCDSILQAKRWEVEGNDNSFPEALFSSQNHSLSTEVESAEGGNKTPTHREYNSRESPSVERGYHSETVYKHETSDIRREWMRRADEFSVTGDSDVFASARSSPYNSRRNASEWTQHEGKYEEPPRVPFYPPSPSPSSAYDYGYSSPFHGSQVSASEQSYYHHQPNQFKQYGREGWFQESSLASPIRETSDGKYYHRSSQSQLHDLQHHNIYESSSSATPHRSVYSERSYQADTAPFRSMGISKSETSSEKSSLRDKKKYARKRNPVVKRYVLPSAGGAPFATCSYCLELLQLPQVSLHGKHKRYQVRCGSCSGVLKFSIREKADIVLDSPNFVDSGMGFADETLTINQDSASEDHEEIYPDGSHLSSSDNGYGDRICKSTDSVMLKQSLETFEDKGMIKEDTRSISSKFLDSKLEALQPSLNHKLREQQPASSETIGKTYRIHLEQSEEAHSEKSTEMDNNILERVGCDLEESGYEKNEPEEMFGDGSGESLEVPVYKNEKMSDSSIEGETVADRPVSHIVEPLNNNEYVSETCLLSENTQEFDWEETQENKEYGGERKWEDIMGDKPGLPMEQSRYIGDSICDSGSSNGEIFEDTAVNEDTKHLSNTFSDAMPQYPLNSLVNESFIGNPDQSGKATVTTSSIHEEQSKYEYENLSERRELDKTINDRVSYELKESRYETNETLEPGKVSECGSVVSLKKASETFKTSIEGETGEERSVSHQMDSPNKYVENSNDRLEPVCLEGSGYAGERTWVETMGDRAGLHLEEYESNYENYSKPLEWTSERAPTFQMWTRRGPEWDADGRSESSSRGSFSDHESSEESVRTQAAKPDQSQYEYENSSERQGLSNTVFDISELQECRYETNETFESGKMVGVGSVVSLEKASETIIGETGEEQSVSHQMAPQDDNVEISYRTIEPVYLEGSGYASERTWAETMGDEAGLQLKEYQNNPHEWTTERPPTFRLHEYELGTIPEPEDDANGRSISSSTDFFNDHESLKERVVAHEEEPWLVDENKTEELKVGIMVEDGPVLHLEKCGNDSKKLEKTFEWTERTPTFHLHESELGTKPEPNEDADGRSESSSTSSFNNHESSKVRAVLHEEETQLVNDSRTKNLQVCEMTEDRVSLDLEKGENESMKLEETFEWTSERAPTFRLHEYELGTMLEPNEEADGRSESSSRGSFNDHEISKEREINHEEQHRLVIDSRIEALQVGEMAKDTVSLHFEECENESMKLDETLEWTSGRALTFRRREYELGTMLKLEETFEWTERTPTFHLHESELGTMPEPNEDADGRSESSSTGSFNNHESSKVRAVLHEEEPQLVNDSRTEHLQVREMTEDKVALDLEKGENQSMKLDETFEWTSGRALTFLRRDFELGTMLNPDEDADGRSESSLRDSLNDRGSSKERAVIHEDEPWLVDDYETKALKADVMVEDGPSLHLEKCENEKMELDQTLEPRDDMFRLSLDDTLEQERMTFHLEMSQNKQENLRQTFKQGEAKEHIPEFGSRVSSEGHESPSKMAEVDKEAEEEILADHLEYLQKEKEKSGLTSELYAHFYNTTEPSEIVGLRHALYQTQTSPLRSPLSSPIHTPIGSPLHYLMESQMRSPVASPMHSHIVSPLRSPINTSGSLSDVLFYGKKV